MSMVFSKNKEKRQRTSSNETNTSFVKNVTSRVSGLLPSTITKWFSSPSSSNANGSAATAEATDSSTEDEGLESPIVTQPPAKRMRYTSNKFNHFSPSDINCSPSNIEITEIPVNHFPGNQFPSTRNNITLTPIRGSKEINDPVVEKSDRDILRFKSHHSLSSTGQSVASKRKSIFDKSNDEAPNTTNKKTPTSAEKKPTYKPSLLGSPFYPGRTTYGGAASSYVNQPNIQQHSVAYVNEAKSSDDSTMSSSARRIMDLLEAYSSPLVEARRIPQYTRPRGDAINTSTERFAPYANRSLSYKTQELHVPNIASLLRLKQRSRLMDTTKTARQIIASHSSASNYPSTYPPPTSNSISTSHNMKLPVDLPVGSQKPIEREQSNKMTTKVKTRVTRTNRGMTEDIHEMVTPVKLPSASLQIDKLPNFSFDVPSSLTPKQQPVSSTPKISIPVPKPPEIIKVTKPTSKHETNNSSAFKFSNPVRISCDNPGLDTTPPKFIFDSPERRIDQNIRKNINTDTNKNINENTSKNIVHKSDVSSIVGKEKETKKDSAKDWQCPDCWVSNKADVVKCVCCGYKQVPKAPKCSVCKIANSQAQKDKCVSCDKVSNPINTNISESSKWKCESCWVMNDSTAPKCVCCGTNKTSANTTEPKTTNSLPVTNNMNSFFGSKDKTDSTFVSIAKTQKSDKWECPSCLVRNESDKPACVCCGADKDPKSKLPDTKFNFGINTSFKFGIDPKVQETKIKTTPEIKLTSGSKLKDQSETNNNVLAETPTFTFSLPTKRSETKSEVPKATKDESIKFTFGIPKAPTVTPSKPDPPKVLDEDNEKPQEVPEINFSAPATISSKPSGGLFVAPLIQQSEKNKPSLLTTNVFTSPQTSTETKKDVSSSVNSLPSPLNTNVEKPSPQSTFMIGTSPLKIASNLFATPTTTSSTNLFATPTQTSAVTTGASNIPGMMPAATTQSSVATTSAPITASAPMFSFGSSSASIPLAASTAAVVPAPVIADKPKFQFTFGSNSTPKTDAAPALLNPLNPQAVFQSPFGDSKPKNTFNLTPGNALGSTNAIGVTNGLTTNGLPGSGLGANTLGGNSITGNPLASNTQPGNGITSNLLGGNTLTGNTFTSSSLTSGNSVQPAGTLGGSNGLSGITAANNLAPSNTSGATNIFASAVQKENMWNSNNSTPSTNLFVSNTTTTNLQKPSFSFGTSSPFNATSTPTFGNNGQTATSTPTFGNNGQTASNTPTFGNNGQTATSNSTFGNNAQTVPSIFGMSNQNNNSQQQPSLFPNSAQNSTPTPLFGSPQQTNSSAPQMGMFGSPSLGTAPNFGTPPPTIPAFEAPSVNSAPAPAFNFGAPPPQATGIFGFGQQQLQQQPPQAGVYSFGGPPPGAPQVQFNMGMAPNTAGRRLRKAVRRATPR